MTGKFRISLIAGLAACALLTRVADCRAAQFWFAGDDPVVQADKHKSEPADYMDLFRPDAAWPASVQRLSVFKVSSQFLNRGSDEQIRTLIQGVRQRRSHSLSRSRRLPDRTGAATVSRGMLRQGRLNAFSGVFAHWAARPTMSRSMSRSGLVMNMRRPVGSGLASCCARTLSIPWRDRPRQRRAKSSPYFRVFASAMLNRSMATSQTCERWRATWRSSATGSQPIAVSGLHSSTWIFPGHGHGRRRSRRLLQA